MAGRRIDDAHRPARHREILKQRPQRTGGQIMTKSPAIRLRDAQPEYGGFAHRLTAGDNEVALHRHRHRASALVEMPDRPVIADDAIVFGEVIGRFRLAVQFQVRRRSSGYARAAVQGAREEI